jgi:hypothetical protein
MRHRADVDDAERCTRLRVKNFDPVVELVRNVCFLAIGAEKGVSRTFPVGSASITLFACVSMMDKVLALLFVTHACSDRDAA